MGMHNTRSKPAQKKQEGTSGEHEDKNSKAAGLPSDEAIIFFAVSLRSGQRAPGGPFSGFTCLCLCFLLPVLLCSRPSGGGAGAPRFRGKGEGVQIHDVFV